MSSVRSALDELRAEDLTEASSAQLKADLIELERDANALDAERLRRLSEMDNRGDFGEDGYLSTAAWLRDQLGITHGQARQRVEMSRRLATMPRARAAFGDGELGFDKARLLGEAQAAHKGQYSADEEMLVDVARSLPAHGLRKAIDYWTQAHDPETSEAAYEVRFQRRRLHVSKTLGGMVRLDGDLDPVGGEIVITALRSLTEPDARGGKDQLTPAQRTADALVDLCRDLLDSGTAPIVGGERPHITVTVDLGALEGRAGSTCELDEAGVITPEAARRLACDAGISRVITKGPTQVLDVGRRTRTIPPAVRRALVTRDGGCAAPGCDRPHRWCDAHHIVHWVDGGHTSLDNLVLLCRRHHRMVHEGKAELLTPLRAPPAA